MSKCPCGFCHLHVHSEYSLLDGANRIKDMAKRAAALDMSALAITDHGVMYGAIDHYVSCKKEGIKPIIGCCIPGQLIYTHTGVKPIEEIEVGDLVLTHEGRFQPVVRTMTRHYSGPLFGVEAANCEVVWLTDEHPIWVANRSRDQREWVRADELQKRVGRHAPGRNGATNWNGYAVFPRLRHEKSLLSRRVYLSDALDSQIYFAREGKICKGKWNKWDKEQVFDLPSSLEISPQLCDLLGLFVAEGSFVRDGRGRATALVWSFGLKRDQNMAWRVVETMRSLFGIECKITPRPDKALLELHCHSTVLARVFESWCGSGAHGKKIPAWLFGADDYSIRAFLNGLVDGDGRIDPGNGNINLKMVARDVVFGVRLLLSRLNIAAKATENCYDGHHAYSIAWNWSENVAYRRFQSDERYLYLPLKSVEQKQYDGPVFNLEVAKDHSYVTDFVLHNCEAYVAPRTHLHKDSQLDSQKKTCHLTLWAKNKKGYENLVKLTSTAHLKGFYYKPRVDHELLAAHSEGIICGSACLGGEVPQLIMAKKFDEAVERALMYRDIFGKENYFLELMDHDLTGQGEVNDRLIDIHHKTGIPLICSNDAHYLKREDEEMHKILVAIGTNSQIQNMALHYGPNFYLKDREEMWDKFKHVPDALENTMRIADMVDLELDLKTTHFPNFDVPAGHDKTSYLRELCKQRFDRRYPVGHPRRAEAIPRMEYELNVIIDKGYPGYFLVVQDFINWSKDQGILVGCRGSAAGCLVSYVLGITNLDPLPYGLLFERFLNPERVSMPDIDVDFPDKRRDEVMKYVTDKYGKDKVAQIITFGTLAARAAVKDTARATGLELKLADQVAKLIPAIPSHPMTIAKAMDEVKELRDLYESDSTVRTLLTRAQNIEGMTRHSSRHACGVVIGDAPLDTMVPLEEKDGLVVTQYHSKAIEKIGLVKMDFLGLTNNSVIDESLALIKERYGDEIDLENIDLTDKKVYDMMGRGDGIAVFQMEGSGMRNLLREMKPENLEHIIAQISLYRPGPMDDIPTYIKGRHGGTVTYPHPKLEPILKDTYGMLLYQEQVMRAAQELAGFTGGQADELRGAMAKKKADQMALLKPLFIDGCVKNKIKRDDATDIFDKMESFAKYAFNKSHAAYYGLVSYWTGFLKVNYASEFLACNMTSRLDAKPKLLAVIEDARKHGIEVLPPDVNESNQDFTVVGAAKNSPIRFGLLAIKGIGEGPVNAVLEARREGGKFVSLHDFCERVPLRGCNKSCIETLIKAGGFDSIHTNRCALLEALDGAISSGQRAQADALTGQTSMFEEATTEAGRPKTMGILPDCDDFGRGQRLAWEKEYIGLYVSDHPLSPLREYLESAAIPLSKITEDKVLADGARVTVGGLVTTAQKRVDKNGRNWAIFTLEDLTGSIEVLTFAKSYEKCGEHINEDAKLLVTGRLSADSRGGFGGGNNSEEGADNDDVRFKIMADDIEIIPEDAENETQKRAKPLEDRISGANEKAEKAAERQANGGGWNGGNGGSNGNGGGAKGHKILESLGKNGGSNGNGSTNGGNGHSNGNGVANGASNGGISINRSSGSTGFVLPPADTPPPPQFRGNDEGPASIPHVFEVPFEASNDVHLHIPADLASQEMIHRLYAVVRKHPGAKQVWIHLDNGQEMVQMKVSANFWVEATPQFCEDVAGLLGDDNIVPPEIG